jgi:hypothetical protein
LTFLDTSFLVKLIVKEAGSTQATAAVAQERRFEVSTITWVEFHSALRRRVRERSLTAAQARTAVVSFHALWATFARLPVEDEVLRLGAELVSKHPLRSLDAIQLASASILSEGRHREARFATSDVRQLAAAAAEGFEVLTA